MTFFFIFFFFVFIDKVTEFINFLTYYKILFTSVCTIGDFSFGNCCKNLPILEEKVYLFL